MSIASERAKRSARAKASACSLERVVRGFLALPTGQLLKLMGVAARDIYYNRQGNQDLSRAHSEMAGVGPRLENALRDWIAQPKLQRERMEREAEVGAVETAIRETPNCDSATDGSITNREKTP